MESVYHYNQDLVLGLLLFFLLFYQEQVLVTMWHHKPCVQHRLIGNCDKTNLMNYLQGLHCIIHKNHCMTKGKGKKREENEVGGYTHEN